MALLAGERFQFAGWRIGALLKWRKTKEDLRQQFRWEDVVRLWREAEQLGNPELAKTIKIAAYSDARIEGFAQLRTTDIPTDPNANSRFMHRTGVSVGQPHAAPAGLAGRARPRHGVLYSIFHSPRGVRHSLNVNFRGVAQSGYDTDDWSVRQSMPL